ncbi:MAG: hypothetical protein LBQ89_03760 [Treponema sp.]|jgi:hypothetical protein|nr:hypothetical protein [Treponema sp.]
MIKKAIFLFLVTAVTASLSAQGFGFGDEEGAGSSGAAGGFSVSVGGEVGASMLGYIDDFSEGAEHIGLGDIFSGSLNFSAKTAVAEGIINLNLAVQEIPVSIDEAYLRAFFGDFEITAGLRKLTWGRADSFGPLDVINPLDYSAVFTEMADNVSLMGVKIARPMIHAVLRFGQSSKIEGVFVPYFTPHYIATEGRWVPAQLDMLNVSTVTIPMPPEIPMPPLEIPVKINLPEPDSDSTTTLDYAQAGLRFTTTIGSADIGAQYYYGRLPQPSVSVKANINYTDIPMPPMQIPSSVDVDLMYLYNPYHQIGIDYAQVLFGFNIRAELAANITEDLEGDDGAVYNPSIAWSFGFDRDLFWGINLNLQVNESIRLFHDKLGSGDLTSVMDGDFDIEGGSQLTSTRLTATVTKRFFRDQLELRAAVVWGIEDEDCAILPALIWTKEDLRVALSGGFFVGDKEGQLGQYKDNNFIKVSLTYMF